MQSWLAAVQLIAPWLYGTFAAITVLIMVRTYILFWLADQKPSRLPLNDEVESRLALPPDPNLSIEQSSIPAINQSYPLEQSHILADSTRLDPEKKLLPTTDPARDLDLVKSSEDDRLPLRIGRTKLLGPSKKLLAPVEFAYLMRRGDPNHAIAVLAVDLIQRAIKSQTSNEKIVLASYELRMWDLVKNAVHNWAQEKKEQILLDGLKKDPIAYVRRMSGIYKFLRDNLATFVVQVSKDPRHLRKYFSFAGIFKLLADFSTAGYQQSFEVELKKDLIARGLLVAETRKLRAGQACFMIAASGFVLALAAFSQPLGVGISMGAILATTISWAVLFIKELIPYYSDVLDLLSHIHRRSWRITLLQSIVRVIRIGFHSASLLTFAGGFAAIYAYVHFLRADMDQPATSVLILALCFSIRVCLDTAARGWQILLEQWPTNKGQRLAAQTRERIKSGSPLEEFVSVLQSGEYDQTFSEMVALYGIETLFFLG